MLPITKALIVSILIVFLGVLDLGGVWMLSDYSPGFLLEHLGWFWFAYAYGVICTCFGIFLIYDLLSNADAYGDIYY